jgi:chloride channel protein, CIC family
MKETFLRLWAWWVERSRAGRRDEGALREVPGDPIAGAGAGEPSAPAPAGADGAAGNGAAGMKVRFLRVWAWWMERNRAILPAIFAESTPLDLRIVGRTLLQAAAVGVVCGFAGAAFFGLLEYTQRIMLEQLAGYSVLRASGETFAASATPHTFRPWLLLFLPALGGLACGWLTRREPDARGGGGDVMIRTFHLGSALRPRLLGIKALASVATLGTGGAGGREGPTMLIGGTLGSLVGRVLSVSARERRILLVAGVAAGISAVFRTPLGAALLAVEVLYKDGFESDALVPSVLASVVSYSVVISIFGESTLLAHGPRFPFVPAHLPLYAMLALLVAALAIAFLATLRLVRESSLKLPGPEWVRPAWGGLALGFLATPLVVGVGGLVGTSGQGLGIFGGGYGAAQVAITGAPWLPDGWLAVELLALLALAKLLASSFTIGTGGSAGDFAPSLAIGALLGGAFGRAAQLLLEDPRIDPGAFALVGMGAFYGGIAHVPLSALVLVCEMAGNYDLLVPLMLALGIAYVSLRKHSLYEAQIPTQRDSPAYRDAALRDVLREVRVREIMVSGAPPVTFAPGTSTPEMLRKTRESTSFDLVPVLGNDGKITGVVTQGSLRLLSEEKGDAGWAIASDVSQPAVTIRPEDDLRTAAELMVKNRLRVLLVIDGEGRIVGVLDESEIAKVYLRAAARADDNTQEIRLGD